MATNLIDYESHPSALEGRALYEACRSEQTTIQAAAYRTLWAYLYRIACHLVRNQPDADDLAQDCAQKALVRIHQRIIECQSPEAFRSWARRIASNLAIDELRRRNRMVSLPESSTDIRQMNDTTFAQGSPENTLLAQLNENELRGLLNRAPISERSRRVVVGRFLDDSADELLAQTESELAKEQVLSSHVQVTRAKNLAKLRAWEPLQLYLKPVDE